MSASSGGSHGGVTALAWIVVAVVMAGSIVAGIALIEWIWPLFWVGVGLMVLGAIVGAFAGMMDMVTEYGPSQAPSQTSTSQ
jgi:hypothetical protein